ncbi:MAG TPA: Fic family protein [Acidobacteriaceae bacterium]|jgi:cell filamentation protein
MAKALTGDDPFFDYPNNILKNIPGYTDQDRLDKFERFTTAAAAVELELNPVRGSFDRAHLQQIHRELFREVFPWAGELRPTDLRRPGFPPFVRKEFLAVTLDNTLAALAAEKHLKGLNEETFSARVAHYFGEINHIHAFREGNGRTQREFFRELAAEAGYRLNWNRVKPALMYEASIQSHQHTDNSGLIAVIRSSIEPPKVFRAPTEPGRGTARDRKELADEAHLLLRSTRGNIHDMPINERTLQNGGFAAGWALAKSQQHVAIATSPNQFFVLHRSVLSKDVELGQKVQLEMKKDRAVVRNVERSRGR